MAVRLFSLSLFFCVGLATAPFCNTVCWSLSQDWDGDACPRQSGDHSAASCPRFLNRQVEPFVHTQLAICEDCPSAIFIPLLFHCHCWVPKELMICILISLSAIATCPLVPDSCVTSYLWSLHRPFDCYNPSASWLHSSWSSIPACLSNHLAFACFTFRGDLLLS